MPAASKLCATKPKIRIFKVNGSWYIQKSSWHGTIGQYCESWESAVDSANMSLWLWKQPLYRQVHELN
jgi:hypothetical protein